MCECVGGLRIHIQACADAQAGVQHKALTLTDISSPDLCNSQQATTPCHARGRGVGE